MNKVMFVTLLLLWGTLASAGQFLIKSEDVLLYQDQREGVLVLHNPTDTLVEQLAISFPGWVQVRELITHDGVMQLTRQGGQLLLVGALLRSGFVQLRWYPGVLLPESAVFVGTSGEWTVALAPARRAPPAEVRTFARAGRGAALITRAEGESTSLHLQFSLQVTIVNLVGIGDNPELSGAGTEFTVSGRFPPGAGIWIEWEPAEAQLIGVHWGDREAFTGHWMGPGWQQELLPDGGFRFKVLASKATQYLWDFGDGATATGREAEHSYTRPGRYLVTLMVTDDNGSQHVYQKWITVSGSSPEGGPNLPPIADPGGPYGPYDWLEDWSEEMTVYYFVVHFDASASADPDGDIVRYIWNFGDGTTVTTTSPYVSHLYQLEEGEAPDWLPEGEEDDLWRFTVTLTVVDDQGAQDTATTYVEVYSLWWWGGEVE